MGLNVEAMLNKTKDPCENVNVKVLKTHAFQQTSRNHELVANVISCQYLEDQ